MANYSEDYTNNRQRDFVLNINEFAHILSKTDGNIKCCVGPYQTSLSQQEVPVIFNTDSKRFNECADYDKAKQLFISAPEGWYIVLKNPTQDGKHPEAGRPNQCPTNMEVGKKVNVIGPTSFALYPGQMAKVIQGHRLRSNQYLLARVYDADAANKNNGIVADEKGNEIKSETQYYVGQLLIIKGTEISFYIPPTGIEVLPVGGKGDLYARDAITLERLEYCILKDENGNKRYLHGPQVVFPKPTESFVPTQPDGHNYCFRAIELSKISGIYVKVIAEYTENNITHPIGEEMFITGDQQMIYYPRPEHAIISYDGKYMHHAIAIPKGEGRYIMNRLTGEIKTVVGPKMYLPDPRFEVVVKRKLSETECNLWYPGNADVLLYNAGLTEKKVEKQAKVVSSSIDSINNYSYTDAANMAVLEAKSNISRGTSYTKPRTITLDNRYDGVVTINVWSGYAVNVVSKSGSREVVVGPATRLLNYDETLETFTAEDGRKDVYLPIENNKISNFTIEVTTNDYVSVNISINYLISFLPEYKDLWFTIDKYIDFLKDKCSILIKKEVKNYSFEEVCENYHNIIRQAIFGNENEYIFAENGMVITDIECVSLAVGKTDNDIASTFVKHQKDLVLKNMELNNAKEDYELTAQLTDYTNKKNKLYYESIDLKTKLEEAKCLAEIESRAKIAENKRKTEEAAKQAEVDMQKLLDEISKAKTERERLEEKAEIELEQERANIEKDKQATYAETVKKIMESVSPQLIEAMITNANANLTCAITEFMSPVSIANGESVAETTNRLLRGTSLEKVIENLNNR